MHSYLHSFEYKVSDHYDGLCGRPHHIHHYSKAATFKEEKECENVIVKPV